MLLISMFSVSSIFSKWALCRWAFSTTFLFWVAIRTHGGFRFLNPWWRYALHKVPVVHLSLSPIEIVKLCDVFFKIFNNTRVHFAHFCKLSKFGRCFLQEVQNFLLAPARSLEDAISLLSCVSFWANLGQEGFLVIKGGFGVFGLIIFG